MVIRCAVVVIAIISVLILMPQDASAQTTQNPAAPPATSEDAVKALNAQRDLVKAQTELIAAQKGLLDAALSQFGEKFGKAGEIKIESGEGDKFHVTARAAVALRTAAQKVCTEISTTVSKPSVASAIATTANKVSAALVTEDDRKAVAVYQIMNGDGGLLEKRMREAAGMPQGPVAEALGPGLAIYGAGMLLSEIADFTKLFRTDRTLLFTVPDLAEQLLVDLVASCSSSTWQALYPSAGIDASLAHGNSEFLKRLNTLRTLREELTPEKHKEIIDRFDQYMTKLLAADDAKVPMLFYVLRGEAATNAIKKAEGRVLTVRLTAKGGTTMKTSNVWRSDRFYVAGGVIVSYRYSAGDRIVAADVIAIDSEFSEIALP